MTSSSSGIVASIYEPALGKVVVFITSHPFVWFWCLIILVLVLIVNGFSSIIPRLEIIKSKILIPLSKRFEYTRLSKAAIKSDIKGSINSEIVELQKYLPSSWMKQVDIDWVEKEDQTDFINDNRVVLRLRPAKNQAQNFINATYHFLKQVLFPKTQSIIPEGHVEATIMHLFRKIVTRKDNQTVALFEDTVLEPAVQKHKKIPDHLEDYEQLDKRGFFTGTFLRELHIVAREVRFKPQRGNMGQEASGIIKHIKEFMDSFSSDLGIASSVWYNMGNISKYGLLLVAHPSKVCGGIDAYINRAKEKFDAGAKRLYVFGTSSESKFFNAVIQGIGASLEQECELYEVFQTPNDYRGNQNGLAAIFIKKEYLVTMTIPKEVENDKQVSKP